MGKLYLIAGHGAGDSGAVGNGYQEAERVRALCSKIKSLGGDNVVYLDPSINYYKSNKISTLNIPKGSWLLECHMDSGAASARGGHVIICSGLGGADKYDQALANMLKKYLSGRANMIVERSDLANPKRAAARGINYRLVEFGFISNEHDVKTFNSKMDDIAKEVLACFGISSGVSAGWKKDSTGWWYKNADGSYPKDKWMKIDAHWYYFNSKGYAVTGWLKWKNEWYYLDADCKMVTDEFVKKNGKWYFLDSEGKMIHDGDITFTTDSNGVMKRK